MKKIMLLLIVGLMLAACGGSEPTPTPVPPTEAPATEAPATEAPVTEEESSSEESGSYVDSLEHTSDPSLVNITWHWVRRDPNGNDIDEINVPNPENYTLLFNEDGTFAAQADCNNVDGRYATTPPDSIFMEAGPSTMAFCGEDSFDTAMLQMFGPAQNYRFEENGNTLVFSFVAGGPVDYYQNVVSPAEESTGSIVDEREHTPDPNLVNKTWAWEGRDPNGNDIPAIVVPNPENYTLFFNEDGTFDAEMDCNNANGRYATSNVDTPNPGIFMELGAAQMAFCGEASLDQQMAQMFGPAQNYEISEDGDLLKFIWAAGGPIDTYRNVEAVQLPEPAEGAAVGTVTAPDGIFLRTGPGTNYPYVGVAPLGAMGEIIGVSEDGEWWLVNAPDLPGGQVWAAAQFVEASDTEDVPVVAAPPTELTLTAVPWEWVSTTSGAGLTAVNDPSRYIVFFNEDGTANIQADCNTLLATYTVDGSSINIMPGPSTLAACPSDSQADQFVAQLSNVAIYFIEGGNLYMDQPADSGTMRFVPQGAPPPVENPPTGGADGSTFYLKSFGPEGATQAIVAGTQITASFADALISGSAGCNNYSASLTPEGDGFTVGPIITSRQFCAEPAGVMDQEQAYLTALAGVNSYAWEQVQQADGSFLIEGQLYYTTAEGLSGVMFFTTSP